jgi:hypothetical protein
MQPTCVNPDELTKVVYSSELDPSMAGLNENDRIEIRGMIANFRPGGVPAWIKESIALTVVMIGSGFIIYHYIPAQIGSQTSAMGADIGSLKESVGTLKTDVGDIKKDIKDVLNKALDRAYPATVPDRKMPPKTGAAIRGAIQFSNSVLEVANNLGLVLDNGVRYGINAIRLASADSTISDSAWRGANLSLAQRALVNTTFVPSVAIRQRMPPQFFWSLPGPVLGQTISLGRMVPEAEGALSDKLEEQVSPGTPHIQAHIHNPVAPEYLLVKGADAIIDEFHLRRIIYEDSRISYHGGRVKTEMVYFVHCTFDISHTSEGEQFGRNLLESVPMSFTKE